MSLCTPCTVLNPVSICTDSLVIGTVGSNNTLYHIFFISLANGMIVHYTSTSSNAGLLTLTPTGGFLLATNHTYELFVNTTQSVSTGENLTIGTITAQCFNVSFVDVLDTSFASQTLSIA